MGKLIAVRMRGVLRVNKKIKATLNMLYLKRRFAVTVLDDKPEMRGMLRIAQGYVAWGEASDAAVKKLEERKRANVNTTGLKAPRGGFASLKTMWPKGELGYRGDKINELVERMMWVK